MGPIRCASCGLKNPEGSRICDCGFRLTAGPEERARFIRSRADKGVGRMILGVMIALPAAVISGMGFYGAMEKGGQHIVFYGAVLAGVLLAWKGWGTWRDARDELAELEREKSTAGGQAENRE